MDLRSRKRKDSADSKSRNQKKHKASRQPDQKKPGQPGEAPEVPLTRRRSKAVGEAPISLVDNPERLLHHQRSRRGSPRAAEREERPGMAQQQGGGRGVRHAARACAANLGSRCCGRSALHTAPCRLARAVAPLLHCRTGLTRRSWAAPPGGSAALRLGAG